MVMTTRSTTTLVEPLKTSVYVPSALRAMLVIRIPVCTLPGGRLAAIASGSCWLPPSMW